MTKKRKSDGGCSRHGTTEMFHVSNHQPMTSSGPDVIGGPRSFHTLFLFTAATGRGGGFHRRPSRTPVSLFVCRTPPPPGILSSLSSTRTCRGVSMAWTWTLCDDVGVAAVVAGCDLQSATSHAAVGRGVRRGSGVVILRTFFETAPHEARKDVLRHPRYRRAPPA